MTRGCSRINRLNLAGQLRLATTSVMRTPADKCFGMRYATAEAAVSRRVGING